MEFKPESTSNQQDLTQKKVSNTFLTNDENKEKKISEIPSLNKLYSNASIIFPNVIKNFYNNYRMNTNFLKI